MISTWAPRVDGHFIKDLPEVLLDQGDYHNNVTVMSGYVPEELAEDLGNVADKPTSRATLTNPISLSSPPVYMAMWSITNCLYLVSLFVSFLLVLLGQGKLVQLNRLSRQTYRYLQGIT